MSENKVPEGKLLVLANTEHKCPLVNQEGKPFMGYHVGIDSDGNVIAKGVLVPAIPYYLRRADRGALTILAHEGEDYPAEASSEGTEEPPAEEAPSESPEGEALPAEAQSGPEEPANPRAKPGTPKTRKSA